MCIFFCFCNTCLFHSICCQKFTKCIVNGYFMESNLFIWNRRIIFCKAYISQIQSFCSFKSCEFIIAECSCDFTCTIRTEVEEDNGIFILNQTDRFSFFYDYRRFYELICFVCCIRIFDCAYCTFCLNAFAFCHGFVSSLYTIPAIIAVHCIVTTHNRCYLSYTDFFHFII